MTDLLEEAEFEPFPAPRRRRRWLTVLVAIAATLVLAGGAAGVWVQRQIDPPGAPGREVTIDIPKGASTARIAAILDERKVLSSARIFTLYLKVNGGGPWQAGRYTFREHLDFGSIVRILDRGPEIDFTSLTIPEGFTLAQVAARVGRLPGRSAEKFLALASGGVVRSALEPAGSNNLEGLLFPETYQLDEHDDDQRILQRLVSAFDEEADELGIAGGAARLGLTPYQVVIVASMIEREANVDEDRGKVARVIYNRLEKGIRLGIDATIRYELNKPTGPLRKSELERDSPFNTRTRAGLPPTPIACPGRESLAAALSPTPGPWIYYVLADRDGHHAFVTTDKEFQRAKAEARAKGLL